MTFVDTLVVRCRDRTGQWLGDLELADSAGEATIHSDDGTNAISISEASSYALLLHRASDRPMRFAAPITSERLSGGNPFGLLRGHVGLGAVALSFNDAEGLTLWRRLVRIELGDPTLQRRHGYRSILRAYLAARAGLSVQWPELSDIVFAETRDVPQLYEIWCLIQLRQAIEQQFGVTLTASHFCLRGERITLPRGSVAAATTPVTIAGRSYKLRLWYNRTFSPSEASEQGHFAVHPVTSGTWSKPMKPDFSIEFTSHVGGGEHEISSWFVHLDAKYRLKNLPSTADHDGSRGSFAPDDIDKMHAYLAGIQNSRAAHILYPGDRTVFFRRGDASASVGAFSAVPGRMETFGGDLRELIEVTFASDQSS